MSNLIGEKLGDFRIVRELGRGGMGVVYEACQESLNRRVALKILGSGFGVSPLAVARFQREAEAAAKLHHSNIVPIYATGEDRGFHFYAMELIEGPSLDLVIKSLRSGQTTEQNARPDPLQTTGPHVPTSTATGSGILHSSSLGSGTAQFDAIARAMAEVADALDHAHNNGVIHRDIKPSNLLLSPDGRLSINDFGLARMLELPGMTTTGEFVGTPAYMSPEQITAGRIPIDHRTDIYSLGATIYELLTLQPPFHGKQRDQVLAQIVQKEPLSPRRINKSIPIDLETICLKCLEKDPDRRYRSGKELADDLRRYVSRFAISARRVGVIGRLKKRIRRHPALSASLALLFLALAGAGYFAYQNHLAAEKRAAAESERLLEQRARAIERAQLAALAGDFAAAEEALNEAEKLGLISDQASLLRGQLARYGGRIDEALDHFQHAIELNPKGVSAHALRALTLIESDRPESLKQFEELLARARSLTPRTADDYLFLGEAEAIHDPDLGLKCVAESLKLRPSLLGRLARVRVLLSQARDRGDLVAAEEAVQEADFILQLLPDHPAALAANVEARTVVIYLFRSAGKEVPATVIGPARKHVQVLKHFTNSVSPLAYSWEFLRALGEQDKLLGDLEQAPSYYFGYALYNRREFAKALQMIDKFSDPIFNWLLLCEFPEKRQEALRQAQELMVKRNLTKWDLATSQMIWLLLGKRQESQAICQGFLKEGLTSDLKSAEFQRALRFLAGSLPEEEYIKAAGTSRIDQNNVHFFVGLTRLSEGKRQSAREHFEKAVATGVFPFSHFELSWLILERMKQDPTWPPWLESKQ